MYRKFLFPFYDRVIKRRNIYNYYRQISPRAWLPLEELRRLQQEKLRRLVAYSARQVPFYERLFAGKGIDIDRVDSIDILRKAGISLTKEMVRAAGDDLLSREFDKARLHSNATSGSTGDPVTCYMTYDNWCMKVAGKKRTEDWVGKPVGTRTTMIWGHKSRPSLRMRMKYALYWKFQNYQFLSAFNIGEESLLDYVEKIKRHRSRFIESYVTVVYLMAQAIVKHRVTPPRLDGILIGAERLFDFQKERIEDAFQCPVFNRYGSSEFMSIASECKEQQGLHINVDNLWVEVVDDQDRPVVGEPGHIVITDLENKALPFIRYRIGDLGIMSAESCSCGRTFPLLQDVVGRAADTFKTEDGREIHEMFFIWKLDRMPGVRKFQVVQKSLKEAQVNVEEDGTLSREKISAFIVEKLEELTSQGVSISVNYLDQIPLTKVGKMKFFISEISRS
ncbi:MAG: phenylacetate--CoA ligase family protein [Candidatus Krumholzibacteriota bacterium]|nr:phenylacetate--CoA ligase family protein [Candidatus Krumholzibacteriota bacterium]